MPSPGAATPYRSAFICRHVTTSKRFPGNGSSAARSSENRPRSSVSLRQCGFVASSRHRSGSPALKFSRLHTLGRGTNSLRRTMPTLDSTAPFS